MIVNHHLGNQEAQKQRSIFIGLSCDASDDMILTAVAYASLVMV